MAKKGGKTLGQLAVTKTDGTYTVTQNPLSSALANLRLQTPAAGAAGSGVTRTDVKKVLQASPGAGPKTLQSKLESQFGSALGASIASQLKPYMAEKAETKKLVKAGKVQLNANAKTIGDIATIFKSGARAQAAAYAVAKADQIASQTGASDSQKAAFMQQLFMAQMQHRWDLEAQAAAQAATDAATQGTPEQGKQAAMGIATSVPELVPSIGDVWRSAVDQSQKANGDLSGVGDVNSLAAQVTTEMGYDAGTPEANFVVATFRALKATNGSVGDAVSSALGKLYGNLPGYDKWGEHVTALAMAKTSTAQSEARSAYIENHPDEFIATAARSGVTSDVAGMSQSERIGAFNMAVQYAGGADISAEDLAALKKQYMIT